MRITPAFMAFSVALSAAKGLHVEAQTARAGSSLRSERQAAKPPTLYLAEEMRVEAKLLGNNDVVNRAQFLAVDRNGQAVIGPSILSFDSAGRQVKWGLTTGGRDTDVMWANRLGIVGSSFWIADQGYQHILVVDRQGSISNTIPHPSWVHPRWSERREYPLFASLEPLAVYVDSTLLVKPSRPRRLLDTPGFDRKITHLLRIDRDGTILRTVARMDEGDGKISLTGVNRGNPHVMPVPFYGRAFWSMSGDGKRLIFATPGRTEPDSGRVRVTMLNENGDTLYSRQIPWPAVRIDRRAADKFLADIKPYGGMTADQIRERVAPLIPVHRSFVAGAHVGSDGWAWIEMRPVMDSTTERQALLLNPRGEVAGLIKVPPVFLPRVVNQSHAWGVERGKRSLLRMRVQSTPPPRPAPPPRSAPASASRPPKPPR